MKWLIDDSKLRMAFSILRKNPDTDVNTLIKLIAEKAPDTNENPLKTLNIETSDLQSVQQGLFDIDDLEKEEQKPKRKKRTVANDVKSGQHWTRNEEEELIAMKHSGRQNKEIAKLLQRSEKAISQKIRQLIRHKRLEKDVQKSRWYTNEEKLQFERCYKKYGSANAIPDHIIHSISKQMKRKPNAILDQFYSIERKERNEK